MYRDELLAGLCRRGLDESVVQAVARVPREVFVPEDLRDRAWEDGALPIGAGQTISQPSLVAYMVALLDLRGGEHVLDVGTGSGYHAAVLAQIAAHVWSIERHPELSAAARHSLDEAGVHHRAGDLRDRPGHGRAAGERQLPRRRPPRAGSQPGLTQPRRMRAKPA